MTDYQIKIVYTEDNKKIENKHLDSVEEKHVEENVTEDNLYNSKFL